MKNKQAPQLDDQPDGHGDAFALVRWMLLAIAVVWIIAEVCP